MLPRLASLQTHNEAGVDALKKALLTCCGELSSQRSGVLRVEVRNLCLLA